MAAARIVHLLSALLAVAPAAASRSEAEVTPVQKVLELLQGMAVSAVAEKQEEEKKFAAFAQWCRDLRQVKAQEVEEGNEKITFLNAEIEKADAHIRFLTNRIHELVDDVGRWKKDQKSVTAVREKEATDYQATDLDYSETLTALEAAITVLKKQAFDREQAEALLQVRSMRLTPPSTRQVLTKFLEENSPDLLKETRADTARELGLPQPGVPQPKLLQETQPNVFATDKQMEPDRLHYSAPEASAYSFQSGGIVEMLEKLEDDFKKKKTELEADELTARHGYEAMNQQLTDNTENAEHEIGKKQADKSETEQAKAQAEGELSKTTTARDEDKKYLDDLTALCQMKSEDFEKRQTLRAEEVKAIKQAIGIISSDAVAGSAEKHLPSFVQLGSVPTTALAQLRTRGDGGSLQDRIVQFLAERSRVYSSKLLSMISDRVAADPFKKVKKLIKDLVVKLMEEATAETEHKGWCDTELVTNKQTRDKKSEEVARLTSEIEDLTAQIAMLMTDIEDLNDGVRELQGAMAKATADRSASKEKNIETVEEAKEAQAAIETAMRILKDYYAKASEATALTQQSPAEDAPETFDTPFQGQQTASGGVIDFLEVILSDFARLESEASNAEASEAEEYDKFMFESKKDTALKQNAIEFKEGQRTNKESDLQVAKEELAASQEQLDKAIAYYEKLKPTCVDSGISYEERVKRREEEIQSLKEALAMLEGLELPSVGGPAMEHSSYSNEEFSASSSSSSTKVEISGSFSATTATE